MRCMVTWYMVHGSCFMISGSGFRVQGMKFRVWISRCLVKGSGLRVQGVPEVLVGRADDVLHAIQDTLRWGLGFTA